MQIDWKDVIEEVEDHEIAEQMDEFKYRKVLIWNCHWDFSDIWIEDLLLDMRDHYIDIIDNWEEYWDDPRFYGYEWVTTGFYGDECLFYYASAQERLNRLDYQLNLLNSNDPIAIIKRAVAEAVGLEE